MKKLLLLLAVMGLMACEDLGTGGNAIEELKRSGVYAWTYLGQSHSGVVRKLKRDGWVENYTSGNKTVYIYNRPHKNWRPLYYSSLATSTQERDNKAIEEQLLDEKIYGELVITYDKTVKGVEIFWLVPTTKYNAPSTYILFSENTHKRLVSDCGFSVSWKGKLSNILPGIEFSNYQEFKRDLPKYPTASIEENASYQSIYKYNILGKHNIYFDNSFYIAYSGVKE